MILIKMDKADIITARVGKNYHIKTRDNIMLIFTPTAINELFYSVNKMNIRDLEIYGVIRRCKNCGKEIRGCVNAPEIPIHLISESRQCGNHKNTMAEYT